MLVNSHRAVKFFQSSCVAGLLLIGLAILGGCNAGSGFSQPDSATPTQVSVGGTVSGLTGSGLTLQLNGAQNLTAANGSFTFPTKVTLGSSYAVTVLNQPVGESCTVNNGTGTNVTAAVSNVAVSCADGGGFVVLYSFHNANGNAYNPYNGAPLQASDGNFYGTTLGGGANSGGAIFRITPQGTESVVYSFTSSGATDGNYPYGGGLVIGPDGAMYGTTYEDGPHGCGTLFRITTSGQYSVVYAFGAVANDPCYSYAGLMVGNDGNFYGLTSEGGTHNAGAIYKVTPGGTETVIHSFGGTGDGSDPQFATLIEDSAGNFYGVAPNGGAHGDGIIFKIAANGTYSILYSFGTVSNDGSEPYSSLTFGNDGNLYGVTYQGGTGGVGVMFKIGTDGSNYTILHTFALTTSDPWNPYGQPLVLASDGNFYSASYEGGASGAGTLYKVTPTGTVTLLHSFTSGATDAGYPYSGIVIANDGYIYGFADEGGTYNQGVFYRY